MRKVSKLLYIYIVIMLFFAGCSHMVEDFKKADSVTNNNDIIYSIIEEFESLDNEEVDSSLTKITSTKTNPEHFSPIIPEGFELLPGDKIFENNVLTIKYTRKRITLTFDPNGGEWDLTENVHQLKGKYGERLPLIDITEIEKVDEKFVGWTEDLNAETVTTVRIPETYPAEDHTYYSVWDNVNSNFIVKIYEENLDYPEGATLDQQYTLVAMNAATGVPGHKSEYKAIARYGFYSEPFEQVEIKGFDEPSAVLEVFYNRRVFTYKFDLNAAYAKWKNVDGHDHNDDHAERYVYGKYEADFTEFDCIECFRDERNYINNNGEEVYGDLWNFEGWNIVGGKVDIKFTEDREYEAVWDKGIPEYTIKHVFEQADGTYSSDSRFPDEKYSAGSEIHTKARAYEGVPGYYALPFEQQDVNVDGSTVVEIKYNRATIMVTLNANGGLFNRGEQIVKITGKYLDPIVALPPSPIKEHHDFKKWQSVHGELPENPTFPAKNIRYEAVYNRTGAIYGVEYYLENLEDSNYTIHRDDSDTKVGDYPGAVTFEIRNHKGFEFDHAYIGKVGENSAGLTVAGDKSSITINDGIAPNDSTVVRVYLKRKRFDVTFDPNGLIWNSAGTWNGQNNSFGEDVKPRTLTNLKYGTLINAVRTDFHSKDKRDVFDYWSPEFTGVVTDEPVQKYTAVTKSMTVQYTVRYLFETIDCPRDARVYVQDPRFPDVATENERELPGFRTQVVIPASEFEKGGKFEGFRMNNNNSEHDIIVDEDISKNIVEIKLDRREIELEFVANHDNAEDAEWPTGDEFNDRLDREVKGKYGAPVVLPADLNDVKWISKDSLKKFIGWETKNGVEVNVSSIKTFPSENMKYFAKWEEIESSEATNNSGSGIIDSAEKDIELVTARTDKNKYTVTVELPFENTGDGLKKWKIYWKQLGDADFTEVTSTQEGFTSRQFTIDYFKNTIYVMAVYEGLNVPFSKDITLKVER